MLAFAIVLVYLAHRSCGQRAETLRFPSAAESQKTLRSSYGISDPVPLLETIQSRKHDAVDLRARFAILLHALKPASAFIPSGMPSLGSLHSVILDRRKRLGYPCVQAPSPRHDAMLPSTLEAVETPKGKRQRRDYQHEKAIRDLKLALRELQIPVGPATKYADRLAERGILSPDELPNLSKEIMDACKIAKNHAQVLRMHSLLLSQDLADLETDARYSKQNPPPDAAVSEPIAPVESPSLYGKGSVSSSDSDESWDDDDEQQELVVSEADDGARIDAALASLLQPLSRTYLGSLCVEGRVHVDGAVVKKKSFKVEAGSSISVRLRAAPGEITVTAEPIDLNIVYEDDSMLAVNKPVDMVVHPAPGHWSGTFANALAHHVEQQVLSETGNNYSLPDAFGDGLRPGVVHRLDRYTSGVLLGAKTIEAQRNLLEAFQHRRMEKVYLAVLLGVPQELTTVTAPIGRHPVDRVRKAIARDGRGREAITSIHRLATDGRISLVAIRIGTGRTHQIRVHAEHIGCPVLGDPVYGDMYRSKKEAQHIARPLLHSLHLELEHPTTGDPLVIRAPPPEDLKQLGAQLAECDEDTFDAWLAPRLESVLAPDSSPEFDTLMQELRQREAYERKRVSRQESVSRQEIKSKSILL